MKSRIWYPKSQQKLSLIILVCENAETLPRLLLVSYFVFMHKRNTNFSVNFMRNCTYRLQSLSFSSVKNNTSVNLFNTQFFSNDSKSWILYKCKIFYFLSSWDNAEMHPESQWNKKVAKIVNIFNTKIGLFWIELRIHKPVEECLTWCVGIATIMRSTDWYFRGFHKTCFRVFEKQLLKPTETVFY
jgi:hypothetical protein